MENKFMHTISLIMDDYNRGDTASHEAHKLLIELNHTAFNLVHFKICPDLDTSKIQDEVHAAQDKITA